jgi:integrase
VVLPAEGGRRPPAGRLVLEKELVSIKAVQHHLGHKSASITLDRYGHLFPDELDQLAEHLERVYREAAVYPVWTSATSPVLLDRKRPAQ